MLPTLCRLDFVTRGSRAPSHTAYLRVSCEQTLCGLYCHGHRYLVPTRPWASEVVIFSYVALSPRLHDSTRLHDIMAKLVTTIPVILRRDSATAQQPLGIAWSPGTSQYSTMQSTNALDLTVLGMCSSAALHGVTCAVLRYRQRSPDAPLRLSIVKVRTSTSLYNPVRLIKISAWGSRCVVYFANTNSESTRPVS